MTENSPKWDIQVQEQFNQMLEKMPFFARPMAEKPVAKKAEELAAKENRDIVCEKDLVDAFFEVTPFGFHGPMISDMDELGIDYKKYGHPIDYSKNQQ